MFSIAPATLGQYLTTIPLMTVLAILFYVAIVMLVFKPFRSALTKNIHLPRPASGVYISNLEIVRAFAIIHVVSVHCWQWIQPYNDSILNIIPLLATTIQSVPIFCALSGFLITMSLKMNVRDLPSLRQYFIRRFLRIYPLYLVVVLVAFLLGQTQSNPTTAHGLITEVMMFRIWGLPAYFSVPTSWSLYPEVTFYVFMPALILFSGRRFNWTLVLIMLASIFVGAGTPREFQLIPFFTAGAIAYELYIFMHGKQQSDKPWPQWIIATMLLVALYILILDVKQLYFLSYPQHLFETLTGYTFPLPRRRSPELCLSIILLFPSMSLIRMKWISCYPIRFISTISYSIYLWHALLLIASFPIGTNESGQLSSMASMPPIDGGFSYFFIFFPAVIFISTMSYLFIEKPFLRLRARAAKRSTC